MWSAGQQFSLSLLFAHSRRAWHRELHGSEALRHAHRLLSHSPLQSHFLGAFLPVSGVALIAVPKSILGICKTSAGTLEGSINPLFGSSRTSSVSGNLERTEQRYWNHYDVTLVKSMFRQKTYFVLITPLGHHTVARSCWGPCVLTMTAGSRFMPMLPQSMVGH